MYVPLRRGWVASRTLSYDAIDTLRSSFHSQLQAALNSLPIMLVNETAFDSQLLVKSVATCKRSS